MYLLNFAYASPYELNQELSRILPWYLSLLIIGLFLLFSGVLKRIKIGSINLRSLFGATILVVAAFMITGLMGAFYFGFGYCYGENCSATAEVATGLVPAILSLFITVPLSWKLIRNNELQSDEKQSYNKLLMIAGLIILIWSSLVYIPRIVTAFDDYYAVDKAEAVKQAKRYKYPQNCDSDDSNDDDYDMTYAIHEATGAEYLFFSNCLPDGWKSKD
jgi:uncharacterized BrkB/YihY/UPF0761 family membrane protein